jgi:uncharacterized protein (UPF0371 family)
MKIGFDSNRYLEIQSAAIMERIGKFGGRLYLEFGGKLCSDLHAARVLPGYDPKNKIKLLKMLGDLEIVYCISTKDLQNGTIRQDSGLTYDNQTLKIMDDLEEEGLKVSSVVITRFAGEPAAEKFKKRLENLGIRVYVQEEIRGYPLCIDRVVSEEGYGKMTYVPVTASVVIVTGAGGGSGKMAFCLSQIYHENQRNLCSGFAKFETFPIWDLPLDHPVNVAYEAATADLLDEIMIDPFHTAAYGADAVNYNRDIENFAIMKSIFERIAEEGNSACRYRSPTDMGVNAAGKGIVDDQVCREAARQEIVRRHFRYKEEFLMGLQQRSTIERMEQIMEKTGLRETDRRVVPPARRAALSARGQEGKGNKGIYCGAALELPDGRIITGKNSPLLHSESAVVLNSIKELEGIPDELDLISYEVVRQIGNFKTRTLDEKTESLNLNETLIALAVSAAKGGMANKAIGKLRELEGCEMHTTHIPTNGDYQALRKLRVNVTTDAIPTIKRYFSE